MKKTFLKFISIIFTIILAIGVLFCIRTSKTSFVGDLILNKFDVKFSTIITVILVLSASYLCEKICVKNEFKQLNFIRKAVFRVLVGVCVLSSIIFYFK